MKYPTADAISEALRGNPVRQLINGSLVDGAEKLEVINPATGEACAVAPVASLRQLDEAVDAARRAQKSWGSLPLTERRAALKGLATILREHVAELSALLTLEQGRPLAQTEAEVMRAAMLLEAMLAIDIEDELLREDESGRVILQHKPIGVVGAIVPWNVPIGLAVPKITHALYAGNTVVLKPSQYTPLATLRLGEYASNLFPPGVLNVLNGGNDLGERICTHQDIAKISLTGSVPTGKRVMASAAASLKRLTLELGGNDACIVRRDADVDKIAPALFAAAFINSGQVCMAIKRLFVHQDLHDRLVEKLGSLASQAKVGDGFDSTSEMGPVQNRAQYESVKGVLAEVAADPTAIIVAGGKALSRQGFFIAPTVVSGVREGNSLVDKETFGPVLPVLSFQTDEEAIERANAGSMGLGASVWGDDLRMAEHVARQLVAGTVWINRHVGVDPLVPFGGAKESGLGRQFGKAGLLEFTETSALFVPTSPK
ncbi:aldehyde dehydrogenase family protein [Cupriavidus sp. amp6]|uniref:aldehyde dehydrogenase family protein n=1 Tax=Cupriavidus sp. amp6 TaxID=388051 RepID=UPI0003F5CB31|nr:aldehyde dehydrogenase family protein [Cupriavidus sp. amp6]